jgi:ABC-2 type transport system ATP-binding protein
MLLETRQLTKDYGRRRALADLDLQVGHGEIFGLLGPNGSGKSTTIRLLLGFLRPTQGVARIAGFDCWSQSVAVRRQVAYLPGELRLYDNLTGRQFLQFLARLHGYRVDVDAERLAARFDIDLRRPIRGLSSGMKRKLALLQVLLPKVPLVILDEPTNTLDPVMRDELLEQLLAARSRGKTILFSSHVLHEVERVCDRVGILSRGRLVHLQTMKDLQQVRQARVRLSDSSPTISLDLPPGVGLQSQSNGELTLLCHGDIQPLLAWLASRDVVDVRIESQGLAPIYQRYHDADSTVHHSPLTTH